MLSLLTLVKFGNCLVGPGSVPSLWPAARIITPQAIIRQHLSQNCASSGPSDRRCAARNTEFDSGLKGIHWPDCVLPRIGRLPAFLNRRDGCRIASAFQRTGKKLRPAIEADGFHGIRKLIRGFPQLCMALRQADVECRAVQLFDARVVRCPPEEPFGELIDTKLGTTAPGCHCLGQPVQIASVILGRRACPQRLRQRADGAMGNSINALCKAIPAEDAVIGCIFGLHRSRAVTEPHVILAPLILPAHRSLHQL